MDNIGWEDEQIAVGNGVLLSLLLHARQPHQQHCHIEDQLHADHPAQEAHLVLDCGCEPVVHAGLGRLVEPEHEDDVVVQILEYLLLKI